MHARGGGDEGEEEGQTDSVLSAEPDAGFDLTMWKPRP